MSSLNHVVDGEAPESDSDVEIAVIKPNDESRMFKSSVVSGEGAESDDDSNSAKGDQSEDSLASPKISSKSRHGSLLHQKLWESNVSLRASIENLVKHTVSGAEVKLNKTDKTLLDVQELMRSTNANLTLAKARLKQMHVALENANCAAAFAGLDKVS